MNWITEAREAHQAVAVPLVEQLRSVPRDAVLRIDTPNALGCMDTRSIPVGRMCHEAADAIGVAVAEKPCGSVCRAGQQDGIACADDECDRENGTRPAGVEGRKP